MTLEEVWFGLAQKRSVRLERWFEGFVRDHCEVFPVTQDVARRCSAFRAQFRAGGKVRTQADMLIAATTSENDLVLVTRNEREFQGCGLRLLTRSD